MHEVDFFGQRLAQCLGHRLCTAIGDEPAADLGFDLLAQRFDAGLVFIARQAFLEIGHATVGGVLRLLHEPLQDAVEVEVPQRAVQVVGAADRPAGLHAGESRNCLTRDRAHHRFVRVQQRAIEHLRELFGAHGLKATAPVALAHHLFEQLGDLFVGVVGIRDLVMRAAQREVHLEDGLERAPVRVVLHQRRRQRVLERLAVVERDVLHRLHGVEVLGERHRQAGVAQLLDEPGEQVEHRHGVPDP